jgi:hypothetical protein
MSISRLDFPRKYHHTIQTGSTSELLLWPERYSSSHSLELEDSRPFLVLRRDKDREEIIMSKDPERSSDMLSSNSRRLISS